MEAKMGSDIDTDFGKLVVGEREDARWTDSGGLVEGHAVCAICLEKILIQETALVKGCEHAYCLTCILRWASYNKNPSCPQCKQPFDFLNVHRSLDGCIHDYMFEESVCLLLRATWFIPLAVEAQEDAYEEEDLSYYYYDERIENEDDDDDDDGEDEPYFATGSSRIRIGNRRWGDNGFIRDGRKEARPVNRRLAEDYAAGPSRQPKMKEVESSAGPSHQPKMKEVASNAPPTGRRAKRALKREAADKAAVSKHQQHLQRLGLK